MTIEQKQLLAAKTGVSMPTINKWLKGEKVQRAMKYALETGCRSLAFELPVAKDEAVAS